MYDILWCLLSIDFRDFVCLHVYAAQMAWICVAQGLMSGASDRRDRPSLFFPVVVLLITCCLLFGSRNILFIQNFCRLRRLLLHMFDINGHALINM